MYNLRNLHQRRSIRRYVAEQMKESLITGVPEIVSCESSSRRAVKSLMFILCTAGFFYQTYTFLESFLKYETVQNMRIEYPRTFPAPAVTFCNKNRINRELFCKSFPEECLWYESFEDFGAANPKLFDRRTAKYLVVLGVPHKKSNKYNNLTNEFLDAYGPQSPWDFIRYKIRNRCEFHSNGDVERCHVNASRLYQVPNNGLPYKCFTIFSAFDMPNVELSQILLSDWYYFWFDTRPEQLMDNKDNVQFYMHVHDARRFVNPFAEGISLDGGHSYRFSLTMQQRQNLPPPYDTNCVDYLKKWNENGGRGPITKKDCIELCKIERMMEQYSCVGKSINYPHRFPICTEIISISDKVVEECSSGCREPCDVKEYTIAVKSYENEEAKYCRGGHNKGNLYCKNEFLKVALKFGQLKIQKMFMEPKFQNIELFSYIGGFIGIWLGVSLVTFVDFLETVADITIFAAMKWKKMRG